MTPKEILVAARKLIEKPEDWWNESHPPRPGRHMYCAIQAIDAAGGTQDTRNILRKVITPKEGSIVDWNAASTHSEVLAGFDAAISLADQPPAAT